MKAVALREKTDKELLQTIRDLRKERLKLRMQKSQGEDIMLHRLKEIRRDIARIETVLTEKEKKEDK
ncbi:50S ribosomal protein L29 [Candidatus Synchoanobacter obligatus]|nr:50S ribosomal protein L29 [Candidatus Synchoanobacter obligatus]